MCFLTSFSFAARHLINLDENGFATKTHFHIKDFARSTFNLINEGREEL